MGAGHYRFGNEVLPSLGVGSCDSTIILAHLRAILIISYIVVGRGKRPDR